MSISNEDPLSAETSVVSAAPFTRLTGAAGQESEAQFQELMAHLEQVFWVNNAADTAVLYVSPAYEKIWGRTRATLYDNSHTFLDSVHPEDRDRVGAAVAEKRENQGYDEEYRILRPDGKTRWIWARTYPVRDMDGFVQRYAGIAEDISERKWAEKEHLRLAAIIEHTEDAIVSITLEGVIIAWNRGAERKYGYTADEVIGRSIFILIPPDHTHEYLETMKRVRQGEAVTAYETVRRRKDGTLINFSVGISPIEARDGEIVGVSKIGHDLSQVRNLEAQLIEAQKMEVIGQLTGGVAHDFNNILAVVLGYSEMMLQELPEDHPMRKYAAAIRHSAERGTGLTRQLLVFSRKEIVQSAVLDLNQVLKDMEGLLRQLVDENIELTITPGIDLGGVKADVGYVGQLLMNFVVNARDAMPNGGKISLATSNVSLGEGDVKELRDVVSGEYVRLSVSDNGAGMTAETKASLFKPFFTTKPKGLGTGLGLSTCQTIVQQFGGHISVQSEIGKGTTFEVYFPRMTRLPEATISTSLAGPMPRGTETLLIVEDDREVRRLVCVVLQALGYRVLSAVNGEEGLRVFHEHDGAAIRLVVSDVMMPGMGGKAMAGQMETEKPELKFLFTSGYTDDAVALHEVGQLGVAFLPKPYAIATLARKVRDLLDADRAPVA